MRLKSRHALLDVQAGRNSLFKLVGGQGFGPTRPPTGVRVPVIVTGHIVGAWSDDDGTSRMFEVEVTKVETAEPVLTDGAGI